MRGAVLVAAAFASLALHLRAEYAGPSWQVYLFKPLTTVLVLLLAVTAPAGAAPRYRRGVAAGLVLSLAGDVLLMLPDDWFVAGLAVFLLAHLAYLRAFTQGTGLRLAGWPTAVYGLAGIGGLWVLWPGLGELRIAVVAYALVICLSAAQAAGRARALREASAAAAAAGAALFMLSDAALAFDRFAGGIPAASLLVMTTYVAAQVLIAASVPLAARRAAA